MSEVELRGVSKRFPGGDRPALERMSLTLAPGELAVLVGPSGCGKSTSLRIAAGLETPSSGRVFIGGRDVTEAPPAKRDVAMVFQSYALYPHMSVYENLAFALRLKKRPAAEIHTRVTEAARALGIESYLERQPKALSGGQRQRVAIGRAMVRDARVFLFDEPLSNLDAVLRGEMRREIWRVHKRAGTTSLYVTHDQVEAMTLADRIVVLKDGVVQQIGAPLDIYQRPANRFVAGFFGTPAMNFLPATITDGARGRTARGDGFALDLPAQGPTGKDVVVGVRPEALTLEERPRSAPLRAAVELREVLGAETLLHLRSEAGEVTVRAEAGCQAREGETLTVWLDPAALHWFDAASERRL